MEKIIQFHNDFNETLEALNSCLTKEQVESAHNMFDSLLKKYSFMVPNDVLDDAINDFVELKHEKLLSFPETI